MSLGGSAAQVTAIAVLLCAAAAGCSSGGGPEHSGSTSAAGTVSRQLPGCTTAAPTAPELPASATATTTLAPPPSDGMPPGPFGVAVAAAGDWGFATGLPIASAVTTTPVPVGSPLASPAPLPGGGGYVSGVDVLRLAPGKAPALVHTVKVSRPSAGVALSPNGRLLLVAGGAGASVISVAAAEQGSKHAVLGSLDQPGGGATAAIEVAITPDGRFAFVSLEAAAEIAVFNLATARAAGFSAGSGYIGTIPTGFDPAGLAVSPDGHWLYATSESQSEGSYIGTLSVISVARAESDPAESVVASVKAGCVPVRVITSAQGRIVWVAARGSDALLAFSAASLRTDPSHALLAAVPVGKAPVGLALTRGGTLIVIADSDRFAPGLPVSNLAVVNVADALAGRPALLGYLPAGRFPRDVAESANGGLLVVANYASGQVEEVDSASLP